MLDDAAPAQRSDLKREIDTNIAELDALVEEVLLASRLEAGSRGGRTAQPGGTAGPGRRGSRPCRRRLQPEPAPLLNGDERLLRRALAQSARKRAPLRRRRRER
jgi:hypothetical protein